MHRVFAFLLVIMVSAVYAADDSSRNREDSKPVTASSSARPSTLPERSQPSSHPESRAPAKQNTNLGKREQLKAQRINIERVSPHCVQAGSLVSFFGQGLSALTFAEVTIQTEDQIRLQSLSITDKQANYRVPSNAKLQSGKQYQVQVSYPNNSKTEVLANTKSCIEHKEDLNQKVDHEPGQLLLLINEQQRAEVEQKLKQFAYPVLQSLPLSALKQTMLIISVEHSRIESALEKLRRAFPEAIIDLNSHFKAMEATSSKPRLYAKKQLAWQHCQSEKEQIKIGLIDGHVIKQHSSLQQRNIISKRFLLPEQKADDEHATAIASILLADKPEFGLEGLLPESRLYSAEVLRKQGEESLANLSAIVNAINWLLEQQVRLINVSLASSYDNQILGAVFQLALKQGSVIFAAAGNNGKRKGETYPAAIEGVIAVTALDAANRIYSQANQGEYVDFSAPGVDIWTADNLATGKYRSGTSYAVPYAVAIAANYLIMNPSLSRDILFQALQNSAKELGQQGHDPVYGWGLLQMDATNCKK